MAFSVACSLAACSIIDGHVLPVIETDGSVETGTDAGAYDAVIDQGVSDSSIDQPGGAESSVDETGSDAGIDQGVPDSSIDQPGRDSDIDHDVRDSEIDQSGDDDGVDQSVGDSGGEAGLAVPYRGFQPKPAGYWSFDVVDPKGEIVDDLDGHHPAFLYGAVVADGRVGQALSFDGMSSYAEIEHDPMFEPGSEGSVAFWIMPGGLPTGNQIVDFFTKGTFSRDWDLIGYSSDTITFSVGEDWQVVSTSTLRLGQWMHVAAVYRALDHVDLYINGNLEGSADDGERHPDSMPIRLGNGNWFSNRGFQGRIDEFATWQAALSPGQVADLYTRGLNGHRLTDALQ